VLLDQLERVAVAGADHHLHASRAPLLGQRADHVVGLVARLFHDRDAQRAEHLLDEAHLALERRRRLRAAGLVLRVLLRAERMPGHVERHDDVRRLLIAQHVDQHRREAEDRVGRLPGGRREVFHGQGKKRPICERMPVEQKQARR
jgi:hypothetical protein